MSEREKMFVIMEVKKVDRPEYFNKTTHLYAPTDEKQGERLLLHPSRIIPASRLRYGRPANGDWYFAKWRKKADYEITGWEKAEGLKGFTTLILDPEPEEKDEWDEWVDSAPATSLRTTEGMDVLDLLCETINWLKRMSRDK